MVLDMSNKCPMKNVLLENTWNCGESCNGALQCVILSSSKAYSSYFVVRDVDDNQFESYKHFLKVPNMSSEVICGLFKDILSSSNYTIWNCGTNKK